MGQPIVVLNNSSLTAEFLERRANIYSDRPTMIVTHEILSGGLLLPTARYGDTYVCLLGRTPTSLICRSWRRMRKASHEALNKVVAGGLKEYQIEEAIVLARNALQHTESWDKLIRSSTASLMLRSVYDESPVGCLN